MEVDPEDIAQRLATVEQALIDERAERAQAQQRAAEASRKGRIWRDRAEERAARIVTLEAERDKLRTATGWLRAKAGRALAPSAATAPAPITMSPTDVKRRRPRRTFPSVAIASNVSGSLERIVEEANSRSLDGSSWDAADLVVIDPAPLSSELRERLLAWIKLDVRPPAAVVDDNTGDWAGAELLLCPSAHQRANRLCLPESIDVGRDVPMGNDLDRLVPKVDGFPDVFDDSGRRVGVIGELNETTPGEVASLAARAIPVGSSADVVLSPETAQRSRRWAWKHRDPAVLLGQFLQAAGVAYRTPSSRVAGLLVSNRPHDVKSAIQGFADQTVEDKELVVGCHGFDPEPIQRLLSERYPDLAAQVLSFPNGTVLGCCLNAAARATSAPLLAKIDDDDHYGPNYLVDALQALRYTGAPVVGKATQFTYVESIDRTVVRRPGSEEVFVDGVMSGGSLVFTRALWEAVGFPERPRKVDVYFLEGAHAAGFPVYSNSRWEFVLRRTLGSHTWSADDSVFVDGSAEAWDGWHPERADL